MLTVPPTAQAGHSPICQSRALRDSERPGVQAGWGGERAHCTLCAKTCPPDPQPQFQAGQMQGPRNLWPGHSLEGYSPLFYCPQQVTKVHEPPREDTAPPKPALPAPLPPQHLHPESSTPQQPGSSPRGKSRSPVPPAEKEGECSGDGGGRAGGRVRAGTGRPCVRGRPVGTVIAGECMLPLKWAQAGLSQEPPCPARRARPPSLRVGSPGFSTLATVQARESRARAQNRAWPPPCSIRSHPCASRTMVGRGGAAGRFPEQLWCDCWLGRGLLSP